MKFFAVTVTALLLAMPALAQTPANPPPAQGELVLEARKAWGLKDRKRLASLRQQALDLKHPLAPWLDYWELNNRLGEAGQAELDAFYARWAGSYVEDRLRNDWLLELGHRRDWANFRRDHASYKMQDDREVACYALLAESGRRPIDRDAARSLWLAQRDADEGCQLLASTLLESRRLGEDDLWLKLRLAVEANKPRLVKQLGGLLSKAQAQALTELMDKPERYLKRKAATQTRAQAELSLLSLLRLSTQDADSARDDVQAWAPRLPKELAAWAWAQQARQSAFKLQENASDDFERALKLQARSETPLQWSEETLAWAARAALRADEGKGRPAQLLTVLALMSPQQQREPQWQYWRARAALELASPGAGGEAQRQQALAALRAQASPLSYYGKLAADELQLRLSLPAAPAPLSVQERAAAQAEPGLQRALQLIALGLRSEGQREWNFSLRGMEDRQLLAAAQMACEREVWDRCISASERTRQEVDLAQRFPMPHRQEVLAQASQAGLDPAYVYGLIRQESRFVPDARSHVGASGLMQVMPATARWTAKKLGLDFKPEQLSEREVNLRLGTGYLKLVLDSFQGSQAMAAAAYNAGPGRPRRWREGPVLDAAVWAENIPFAETRDYVRKVLSNATVYAQLLGRDPLTLRERLGRQIGPAATAAAELP
jgi:soluble lytic murein transglycosylase